MLECPGCEKEGPFLEENGYELLLAADREGKYHCEDCGKVFWWP